MVMSVTEAASRGGGLLQALGFPRSHQNVTKNFGQAMNVSWPARNNASVSRQVKLAVWEVFGYGSKAFVMDWLASSIPAGGQVTVPLLSIPPLFGGFFPTFGGLPLIHNCELRMLDVTGGEINAVLVAVHTFVLTAINI